MSIFLSARIDATHLDGVWWVEGAPDVTKRLFATRVPDPAAVRERPAAAHLRPTRARLRLSHAHDAVFDSLATIGATWAREGARETRGTSL